VIEILASAGISESPNSPGWFLVHSIGVGMGILGLVFFLGAAVGMVRFPDFYTRMHAAGKGDTLSTMLMLGGFGLVMMDDFSLGSWLLLLKILGIVLFIFITTPTSSHALMRAAFEDDEMPLGEKDLKKLRRKSRNPKTK
jgi:multicomponent Na+:H+ antiporter subunit G